MLKCEIDDASKILESNSVVEFSVDDVYEVEYIVECMEKNARRLKSVLQCYRHQTNDDLSHRSSSVNLPAKSPLIAEESDSDLDTSSINTKPEEKQKELQIEDSDATLSEDLTDTLSPCAAYSVCLHVNFDLNFK